MADKAKPRRRSGAKTAAVLLGVTLFALLGAVVLLEVGLRVAQHVALGQKGPVSEGRAAGSETILCLGDSWTFGQESGDPSRFSYPAQLQGMIDEAVGEGRYRVVNEGKPGETTAHINERLEELVDRHKPSTVVLLAGGTSWLEQWQVEGWLPSLRHLGAVGRLRVVQLLHMLFRPAALRDNQQAVEASRDLGRRLRALLESAPARASDSQGVPPLPTAGCEGLAAPPGKLAAPAAGASPEQQQKALRALSQAHPGCSGLRVALAERCTATGDTACVKEHAGAALKQAPDSARARVSLALTHQPRLANDETHGALGELLEEHPEYIRLRRLFTITAVSKFSACFLMQELKNLNEEHHGVPWVGQALALVEQELKLPSGQNISRNIMNQMEQDLARARQILAGRGVELVLLNYPRSFLGPCRKHVVDVISGFGAATGVPVVDLSSALAADGKQQREAMSGNFAHPNREGYRKIAAHLFKRLRELGRVK